MLIFTSMTLTLVQDHSGSANAQNQRCILSATKQTISVNLTQRGLFFLRDRDFANVLSIMAWPSSIQQHSMMESTHYGTGESSSTDNGLNEISSWQLLPNLKTRIWRPRAAFVAIQIKSQQNIFCARTLKIHTCSDLACVQTFILKKKRKEVGRAIQMFSKSRS